MQKDVFISYASVDAQWAIWIAGVLERNGFSVFIGAWDLLPGDDFVTKTNEAIRGADVFIPILSDAYTKSIYCTAEFGMAFSENASGKLKLIPVRVSDTALTGMLANIIYVDLYGAFDEAEAERRLINALNNRKILRTSHGYPEDTRLEKAEYPGGLPINNLPQRNSNFIGGDNNLYKIAAAFEKSSNVQIVGIGGIGKTQLALEYAYRFGRNYNTAIWFISAIDKTTVLNGFIAFCKTIGIKFSEDYNQSEVQKSVKKWLKHNDNWLLVVNDLITVETIEPYLPTNHPGHILVTTRNQIYNMGAVLNIGVLSDEEAIELLKSHLPNYDSKELHILANRLGHLPLALEHAASYIRVTEVSVSDFIQRFESFAYKIAENPNQLDETIFASLQISLSNLSQSAKQLLNLCAYLAPYEIPFALFIRNRDLLPDPLRSNLGKEDGVTQLFDELSKFSYITGNRQEFGVHPYYQRYLRYMQEDSLEWLDICLRILLSDVPREYDDWESKERFVHIAEHAQSVATYIYSAVNKQESKRNDVLELYSRLGYGFYKVGQYDKSLDAFEKTLNLANNFLGNEFFDVAATYSNIGRIYDVQGKYEEAIECFQKALTVSEAAHGNEHPSIAQIYVNIATIYYHLHNFEEALELNAKALSIQEKQLGSNHPATATTIENIASIYYNLNELDKSLTWHYKALAIFETVLGTDHPDTANALNNIGVILDDQGYYEKALVFYQKALAIFEKVFGRDNADTAQAYNNIALNYRNRGDYTKALEWYKKALSIFNNVLGTSHPLTATIKVNVDNLQNVDVIESSVENDDIPTKIAGRPLSVSKSLPDAEIADLSEWYASLDNEAKLGSDLEFRMFLADLQTSIKKIKEKSEFSIDDEDVPELCQYTKLSTLKFLVRAASEEDYIAVPKFRLSNVAYLNDPSEGQVFIDLLNYCIASPIFDDLLGVPSEKGGKLLTEVHLNDVYIGSFSTAKNKLPMWTLYGDNSNGCCVVFDNSFFTNPRSQTDISAPKEFEQDIRLYKVNYYNIRELDQVNDEIMRFIRAIATSIERWYKIVLQNSKLLKWVVNRLGEIRFLFKCDDYLYEDEIRLILRDDRVNKPFVDRSFDVPKLFINVNNPVTFKEVILGSKVENPSAPAQFLLFAGVKKITLSGITYR